jgi:5'-nucleotidase
MAPKELRSAMRILLTNDDGIRAPGIVAMHDALIDAPHEGKARFGGPMKHVAGLASRSPRDITETIAPLTVQSATGHGVTFHMPLMVKRERVNERMSGFAVDARPADCVKLAIANLWPEKFGAGEKPDLLISGVNSGANCGINVIYSGTVAAALEGAFLGVPSIAVSLRMGAGKPMFDVAAGWARTVIEKILARGMLRSHECISINIPATEQSWSAEEQGKRAHSRVAKPELDRGGLADPGVMPQIKVCPMNTHGLVDSYERRTSPAGDVYYWAAGHGLDFRGTEPGSDVDYLMKGFITVTPLMYDLTRREGLMELEERLGG